MDEQQAIPSTYYDHNRLARQEFETLEQYHKRQAFEKKAIKMHKYGQLIKIPKDQRWYKIKAQEIKKNSDVDVNSENPKSSL